MEQVQSSNTQTPKEELCLFCGEKINNAAMCAKCGRRAPGDASDMIINNADGDINAAMVKRPKKEQYSFLMTVRRLFRR